MKSILLYLLILLVCFSFAKHLYKRDYYVCDHYIDYYLSRTINPHCHYNPDVGDVSPSVISRHGYKVSEYNAETEDGYILDVVRIHTKTARRKGVVFLQHPYTTSSQVWVDKGKNMSLGLMLVDHGYEVWLGNSRGTILSPGHKYLTMRDKKFWDYSFHEIGYYDLSTSLQLAKKISGVDKITYISHSAGSTAALIYASLRKAEAKDTINLFITMGPVSYLIQPKLPIRLAYPLIPFLKFFVALVGDEKYQKTLGFVMHNLMRFMPLLVLALSDASEYTPQQKYPPFLPLLAFAVFENTNLKQLLHYAQLSKVKKFQQYDYGLKHNKEIYGTEYPPQYPVSEIVVPFQIIYSEKDSMFGPPDAGYLYNKLRGTARQYKPYQANGFNHIDFSYGKYVNNLYKWIIEKVDEANENGYISTKGY